MPLATRKPGTVQQFDLKVRVYSQEQFCCPLCHCPISMQALLNPPPKFSGTYVRTIPPEGPQARLARWAEQFCMAERISIEDLRNQSRAVEVVAARRRFCRAAYATGQFSMSQLGRFLGLHHTSVLNLIKPRPANGHGAVRHAPEVA
jgi:hypothetical protein